ncbi:hypothetical protein GIY23_12865 [Allosaccharopolyspora coralli]|uniref:DUF4235 domain-containing protein n=1 Tax=Allosaccharopolyspora coralli TaxID=2665642 RepID=A0A5Q3QAB0_9PSEU|nr:hypothetical protein [Allosaccharopolyspora coralli]QGK70296.1 hypothetical protein GIY23_12865 [Allosaccharopolyspora coralli]
MFRNPVPAVRAVLLVLAAWIVLAPRALADWAQRVAADDEGSETTEKAVLTAIGLAVAVGLGAAITGVVNKYQGQIH